VATRNFLFILISFDSWSDKKSGNWRKSHASANQIPEFAELWIFSRKIPALWARLSSLELSF
jgi:hypothetical protein